MGFQLKSPTPGVFQSQFPTPMGDGGGVWGWGENPMLHIKIFSNVVYPPKILFAHDIV